MLKVCDENLNNSKDSRIESENDIFDTVRIDYANNQIHCRNSTPNKSICTSNKKLFAFDYLCSSSNTNVRNLFV
jgi:hypothetical protein